MSENVLKGIGALTLFSGFIALVIALVEFCIDYSITKDRIAELEKFQRNQTLTNMGIVKVPESYKKKGRK